jgi:hypothetical protein
MTDRTTITTDWTCQRARWWYKHEGGTGIVPAYEPEYFEDGRAIHEDMAAIAIDTPLADIISPVLERLVGADTQLLRERLTRRVAWACGVSHYIEPLTRQTWRNHQCESELILDRSPLWVACTPDRVLQHLDNPTVFVYREYKSVSMITGRWASHWRTAIQMHIGLKAYEEETGIKPAYGEVMGLNKGQWKDGYLHHPYVWAWTKGDEWFPEWAYGRERQPVWDYPDGIEAWVLKCGEEVAMKQFPFSHPIYLNERLLDDLITSQTFRELQVSYIAAECQTDPLIRARVFPCNFERCEPVVGAPCVYLDACHNEEVNSDPLGSGLYIPRTPHHEMEVIGVD